jgi:hypothetical protein
MIHVLYNRDIDITVSDKTAKNRVYRLLLINELKIFKKNYLVKMSDILLSV